MPAARASLDIVRGGIALVAAWVAATAAAQPGDADAQAAKRVFDARCVACHSCYNAPCQLDLTSFEGVARGATDLRVYQAARLRPATPTRLGVDAQTPAEWRERGFFPVLDPLGGDSPADSLLGRMLALKRASPERRVREAQDWMCPSGMPGLTIYGMLGRDGMPHGFPAIDDASHAALMRWLREGAPLPADPAPAATAAQAQQIADWERFLNDPDPRHRLVARYFYEHLFLAHTYVGSGPSGFYRLIRSATAAPEPAREIATVHPFDDPGDGAFHYRFVPVTRTLVHKTHITFELSSARLERYRQWFLAEPWPLDSDALPGYDAGTSANPFKTFQALPARARYRFLLDNARYFVMSFIRGPVCEGQMAVNVINDHFHVLFLDPSHDLSVNDPAFLRDADDLLALPASGRGDPFSTYYLAYKRRQREYTAYRERHYAKGYPEGAGVDAIWNGARSDRDAALTVFRHFDNAAVVHGLRGGAAKTLWVMDYPIFERIYYLLVAGFNVYGNAFHQAATRLYMDNLRVEAEDLFLSFLPPGERRPLRDHWYRGMLARIAMDRLNPLRGADRPTAIDFDGEAPKQAFIRMAAEHLGPAAHDPEARFEGSPTAAGSGERAEVEAMLQRLTGRRAPFVAIMPDLTYLLIRFTDGPGLYALIRNKAHLNVAFPVDESDRRLPEEDTLSVLRGVAGSYPNFILDVAAARVPALVNLLEHWAGRPEDHDALFEDFGASRYEPGFWSHYDRVHDAVMAHEGLDGARLDLGKYVFR